MTWKHDLKLRDVPAKSRFEITCQKCRKTRTMTQEQIVAASGDPDFPQRYLDEVEGALRCSLRRCGGKGDLVLLPDDEMYEPFVGGLA